MALQTQKQFPIERTRDQKLCSYINNTCEAGKISPETAARAGDIWKLLGEAMHGTLPVPDVSPGPEGQLLFLWDKGEHHLELEVFADAPAEFFYRNRVSGVLWGADYPIGTSFTEEIQEKLRIFK